MSEEQYGSYSRLTTLSTDYNQEIVPLIKQNITVMTLLHKISSNYSNL